ncbi:MAG TPA: hypothetical protein V6C81_02300 [Planktothrix sp.]
MRKQLQLLLQDESGQGITEYGAILAFVAVLIGCIFGITKGSLSSSIYAAFSAISTQLNNMSAASGSAS